MSRKRNGSVRGYEVEEGASESEVLDFPFPQAETIREPKFGDARTQVTLAKLVDLEPVIKVSDTHVTIVWGQTIRELVEQNLSARDRQAILHDLSRRLLREFHDSVTELVKLQAEHGEARAKVLKRRMS